MRTMRTMQMGRWHSLIPPVTNSPMDTDWQRKKKNTEGYCHDLLSLPCLIMNRGGCVMCVCVCVFRCVRCREVKHQPGIKEFAGYIYRSGAANKLHIF